MEPPETVRVTSRGRPLKKIRVEVIAGPDRGESCESDEESLSVGTADGNSLVLSDPTISRFHLTISRRGDRLGVTDHASTNGTDAGPIRVQGASVSVRPDTELQLGETTLRLTDGEVVLVEAGLDRFGDLRARDAKMKALFAKASRVAAAEVSVLLQGESGTGKELLARAIHDASPRADQPFVTFDCAAVMPSLFESALFGHEKGAFTGADKPQLGAAERANEGTLFLDEIGELAPDQQTSLLGVLERGRFQRVGGDERPTDVRVIAATNRDLQAEVNRGAFRLDLFYRVATVRLEVPPLRERPVEVPFLIDHFLDELGEAGGRERFFERDDVARLKRHPWPGNVRELRNVVHAAVALGAAPELYEAHGGDLDAIDAVLGLPYKEAKRRAVDEFERRYLDAILGRSGGNIRQAARDAEMNRSYLMELMKRHGLR